MYTTAIQNKLVSYLLSIGAKEVYLFGSQLKNTANQHSDIDIGVLGLASEKFFRTWVVLEEIANMKIDLVDFDSDNLFFNHLKKTKSLKKIGGV